MRIPIDSSCEVTYVNKIGGVRRDGEFCQDFRR